MRSVRQTVIMLISSALLLALWQIGAWALDSQVLLPGLGPVFRSLVTIVGEGPFFSNVWATVARALQSFLIIVVSASALGILGGKYPLVSAALRPFVTTLKAVPVMSVILLAFIWFSSGEVPLFSAFLMGFPVMYVQVESGWRTIDPALVEMCEVFEISGRNRLLSFTIPSLLPSLITGARVALSMIWKVIVAAEVLTVPRWGVGSRMQLSQVQLQTDRVLSWTLVAIFLTAAGDLIFSLCVWAGGRLKVAYDKRRIRCALMP